MRVRNHWRHGGHRAALMWLVVCAALPSGRLLGQTESVESTRRLEFYRLFVPRKEVAKVARGHLPMERKELMRRLKQWADHQARASVPLVRLERSDCRLRFDGRNLRGTARWTFAADGSTPSWVSLEPAHLALRRAVWEGRPEESPAEPAIIGVNDRDEFGVVVDRSGTLLASWTVGARQRADGAREFRLELPACAATHVELELPPGWRPTLLGAGRSEGGPPQASATAAQQRMVRVVERVTSEQADAGRATLWRWHSAGGRCLLVLAPSADRRTSTVRSHTQQSTYQLSLGGIEWQTDWAIEMTDRANRAMAVAVPPGVSVLAVKSGPTDLPWRLQTMDEGAEIIVEWPADLSARRRALQVTAVTELPLDESFTLPTLRLLAPGWRQHILSVQIDRRLQLTRLSGRQCVRAADSSSGSWERSGRLRFVAESEDGSVLLEVTPRRSRVRAELGTHIRVSRTALQGTVRMRVFVESGELYSFPLTVATPWRVDSIDCDPPDRLEAVEVPRRDGKSWQTMLRLRQPITPQMPLDITLRCHHPPVESIDAATFRPVRWGATPTQRWVAVDLEQGLAMQLSGDAEIQRLDRSSLEDDRKSLLPAGRYALAFVDDRGAERFRLRVSEGTPRYEATTLVEAVAGPRALEERFRVRCVPSDASMSRMLLRVTPAAAAIQWRVISPPDVSVTARKMEPDAASAEKSELPNTEQWELLLGRDVAEAVVLEGVRMRALDGPCDATLVYLPQARNQQAHWALRVAPGVRVGIDSSAVRPLPLPPSESGAGELVAWFSYSGGGEAQIRLRPLTGPQPELCWAASCDTVSFFDLRGHARHWTRYRLVNQGRREIALRLPEGASPEAVTVRLDGKAVDRRVSPRGALMVSLPENRRGVVLDVEIKTVGPSARWRARVAPTRPRIGVPVFARSWRVALPAAWRAPSADRPASGDWRRRLAGSLRISRSDRTVTAAPARQPESTTDLENALRAVIADSPVSGPTWGEWLDAISRSWGSVGTSRVWVAARSLRERGITARTPLWEAGDKPVAAEQLLRRYGLVWRPVAQGYCLAPARLDFGKEGSAERDSRDADVEETCIPLALWRSEPAVALLPWERDDAAGRSAAVEDWGVLVDGDSVTVWHRGTRAGLLTAVWALVSAVVVQRMAGRWFHWWLWLVFAGFVAVLVPAEQMAWGGVIWLGVLAAGLWTAVSTARCSGPVGTAGSPSAVLRTGSVAVIWGGLLIGGWLTWSMASAQDAGGKTDPLAIVVPIDEKGEPSGEYDYVPRSLYERLVRLSERSPGGPRGWVVVRGEHEATAGRRDGRLHLSGWVSDYALRLFDERRELAVPLPPLPVQSVAAEAQGVPVPVDWEVVGSTLRVRIPATGSVRLHVECRDETQGVAAAPGDVHLLPAAQSTLRISGPLDAVWQVDGALGSVVATSERGELRAELGRCRDVRLHASSVTDSQTMAAPQAAASETWWLRIQADSVVLEYALESDTRLPGTILLDVDPALQPLVLRAGGYAVSVQDSGRSVSQVQLARRSDLEPQTSIRLRFLWRGRQGIGRFELPRIEPRELAVTTRTVAVSADRDLAVSWLDVAGTELDPRTFVREREGEAVAPLRVLRGTPSTLRVHLATRLLPASVQVAAMWSLHVSQGHLQWALDLDWKAVHGRPWRQVIRLPPTLKVERARWTTGGTETELPFIYGTDGTLTVLLAEMPSESRTMRLTGTATWRSVGRGQRVPLPRVECPTASLTSVVYRLWRDQDVLVVPGGVDRVEGAVEPVWEDKPRGAWWLGSYRLPASDATATLSVRPNRPRIRGWLVAHAFHQSDRWWLEIVYGISVVNAGAAQLDSLRLEVPAHWRRLEQMTEQVTWRWEAAPDPTRQRLVLVPQEPVTQPRLLRFVVPLEADDSEQLQVPSVVSLDGADIESYIVLPRRIDQGRVSWVTQGLFRRPLPEPIRQRWKVPADRMVYRVIRGTRPTAVIDQIRRRRGRPQVWLADLLVVDRPGHRNFLVARYDLVAVDRQSVDIRLPERTRLIAAQLDDRPARATRLSGREWRLELTASGLPQRLELLCELPAGDSSARAPLLKQFVVRRTLWTVASPQGDGVVWSSVRGRVASWSQAERSRMDRTARLLEQTLTQTWHGSPDAMQQWYRGWAARLWCLASRSVHSPRLAQRPVMDRLQRHIAAVGGSEVKAVWSDVRRGRPQAGWLALWLDEAVAGQSVVSVESDGWLEAVAWQRAEDRSGQETGWMLVGVLLVGGLGIWFIRIPAVTSFLTWPSAWAFLAGLYCYFVAGALGWSIALLLLAILFTLSRSSRRCSVRSVSSDDSRSRSVSALLH